MKPGGRACDRGRRNTAILHSNPAPVSSGSQNPRHTYLEKRETPGREGAVISLSGRQARVGSEGFRHKPHHSIGSILLSDIQELAHGEGNAASLCSAPALWEPWEHSGSQETDSKHRQSCHFPEMPEKTAACQRWQGEALLETRL